MRRALILLCEKNAFVEPRITANRIADINEQFIILNTEYKIEWDGCVVETFVLLEAVDDVIG